MSDVDHPDHDVATQDGDGPEWNIRGTWDDHGHDDIKYGRVDTHAPAFL
ncbi:MAG: hypothetical protein GTO62_12965, partial [Planctomycetales bacterium]|nr:hypothetical protein [Planctomycetales bacterium]